MNPNARIVLTTSLPRDLVERLDRTAKRFGLRKNELIADGLTRLLDQLDKHAPKESGCKKIGAKKAPVKDD